MSKYFTSTPLPHVVCCVGQAASDFAGHCHLVFASCFAMVTCPDDHLGGSQRIPDMQAFREDCEPYSS